jgi:hypothetical protein
MELLGLYQSSNTNMVHDTSDGVFIKLVEVIPEKVLEEKAILTRFCAHELQDTIHRIAPVSNTLHTAPI